MANGQGEDRVKQGIAKESSGSGSDSDVDVCINRYLKESIPALMS